MAIASVLLYLAVIYIRPGEIISGWQGYPIAAIAEVLAFVVVGLGWLLRPKNFLDQPQDLFVYGFFAIAIVSNPAWGWMGGAVVAADFLIPVFGAYLLIRASARTPRHLRWIGGALVALTLFQAVNGITQFVTGVGLGNVSAFQQRVDQGEVSDGTEQPDTIARIRGTGIFNDPNDLAMAFVVVMPFLIGPMLVRRTPIVGRLVLALIAIPILIALFYTNSRGGMLGFLAAMGPYIWRAKSALPRVMVVLGVVAVLAFGPSRMSDVDSDEDSAQGRVQAWSAGLQMLKSRPIIGVGFSRYEEFHIRAAHNSFVHTVGELGLLGGLCFTGMFYWLFRGLLANPTNEERARPELLGLMNWGEDLLGGCVGLATCMFFLSRQYTVIVFIWLALGASYRSMLQSSGIELGPSWSLKDSTAIVAALASGVVVIYVVVRLLGVWSGISA